MVRILYNSNLVAWDDHKDVVVRAIKDLDVGYKWEVRWALPFRATAGDVTEIILQRWFLRGIPNLLGIPPGIPPFNIVLTWGTPPCDP